MVAKIEVVNYSCEVCATKYATLALAESCEQKCSQAAAVSAKVAGALDTFRFQATSLLQVFEFLEAAIKAKSNSPKTMKVTCFSPILLRKYPVVKHLRERLLEPIPANKRYMDTLRFYMSVSGSLRVKQGDSWIHSSRVNSKDLEIPGMYSTDTRNSGVNHAVILPLVEWPGISKSIEEALEKEEALRLETVSLKKQFQEWLANDPEVSALKKESQELDLSITDLQNQIAVIAKKKTGVGSKLRKRLKTLSEQSDLKKKIVELESETLPSLKEHHQSLLGFEIR